MDEIQLVKHHADDDVAVAVVTGLAAGTPLRCWIMDTDEVVTVTPNQAIPLGHKVAVRAVAEGQQIIKYGWPIGRATTGIEPGDHVHVHNLRSQRW